MYIENINGPQDVKKLTVEEMRTLADEMRHALLVRLWYGGDNHSTSLCI